MRTFKHKMTIISVVTAVETRSLEKLVCSTVGSHKYVDLCFGHSVEFYHTTYVHTIR